ncbi:phosphoadenosine phosphosulfate reductase [Terrimicrobium sacchariphilum]|uniref:Adenosine 5'-phosphosulfate reductase n=1 Tax=Terrimicrobium sacchariphilum TaxID=690879 RepID=A0A146G983_TERSA|nr:phosphoadenylyl-sulfate reductase [Terrimicrobium sacchariphilum]GAT33843.1 phosphoadenosine phosphosulfate reductase [Terrimicrobium sacchariphilum]
MSLAGFDLEELRRQSAEFENAALPEILRWCWDIFGEKAAIGTSFQGAGLVAMDVAYSQGCRFPVFTIDTGLLFPETLELKAKIEARLGITIESLVPEQTLDQQASELGPELWNHKPDLCCTLRKVVPLQAKLSTLEVWITGLRRQQSDVRQKTQIIEVYNFDVLRDRHIIKLNPMANWSRDAVQAYMREHGIPSNALTARGYRSIGCIPCTRPISEGQDERAGRWTGFDKTECGIHTFLGESI